MDETNYLDNSTNDNSTFQACMNFWYLNPVFTCEFVKLQIIPCKIAIFSNQLKESYS